MEQILADTPDLGDELAAEPPASDPGGIQAFKAPPLVLSRHLEAPVAFQTIIGAGLAHFLGNTPAGRAGDAEGVHQTRVALRRLRTALALFAPVLRAVTTDPLEAELKRLGQVFGAARDWDVFRLETLPQTCAEAPEPGGTTLLAEAAERKRRIAHAELLLELDGAAMAAVVTELGAWASGADPCLLTNRGSEKLIAELAPDLLDRLARKAAKRRNRVDEQSDADLHALRKSLKKLRYGAEDFSGLYKRKRTKAYLGSCKRLLEALGTISDAAGTKRLLDRLAEDRDVRLAPAIASVARWREVERAQALARFGAAWQLFANAKPFWK